MGGQQINCPLCCDSKFESKQALLEHLANVAKNLYCPLCNTKWTSLEGLTKHLSLYDCQTIQNDRIVIYDQSIHVDNIENSTDIENADIRALSDELSTSENSSELSKNETYEARGGNGVNKMYVELLSKQLSKPVLQTQELKLIKEEGESRYMIVSEDGSELSEEGTIVTKQNNDGTISLTTLEEVSDMKLETDTLIAPDPDAGNSQQELYSCNACKVSFTSVLDHIQNYHNDQEVVLEDIPDADSQVTEEFERQDEEASATGDKQPPRRVITDTGDIVEEPVIFKTENMVIQQDTLAKPDPYHKVVTKEMQTKTGFTVKMYHCMSCNVSVNNLNDFQTHPCKILKYPCPRCPAAFENSKSLCAHMKVHKTKSDGSPDVPVSYQCEVCCTVFPTNKSLKLHKRMHDPIKARPIEPPVENKDVNVVYRCSICDKDIPFDYRAIHEASHKTSDKMNCSICNKKFNSMEYLDMHMSVHNLDKAPVNNDDKSLPYNCLYCHRRFARPHEKVKHERIHTGEKPHSCEICGKSFRVSYCLTLHMRTHTGARPYACAHCGKRFKAHSVYNHHLLTHSEVRAYKCPYCPKAFKTSVQLAGHKNSHTKPFSCQQCNRPFASLYAVRVHTETHARQNNLKFSCTLCGASYARAFALKDHVKQVHKQDMNNVDNIVENTTDEDWLVRESTADADGIPALNKELQQDVSYYSTLSFLNL